LAPFCGLIINVAYAAVRETASNLMNVARAVSQACVDLIVLNSWQEQLTYDNKKISNVSLISLIFHNF
jgi:hypothetical protein